MYTEEFPNISFVSDYFNSAGLQIRTGLSPSEWDVMFIKELVDNSLDALETSAVRQVDIEYSDS